MARRPSSRPEQGAARCSCCCCGGCGCTGGVDDTRRVQLMGMTIRYGICPHFSSDLKRTLSPAPPRTKSSLPSVPRYSPPTVPTGGATNRGASLVPPSKTSCGRHSKHSTSNSIYMWIDSVRNSLRIPPTAALPFYCRPYPKDSDHVESFVVPYHFM